MVRAVLKSYRKNILREMKDNLSRMVSLFGIVALGVMMLTGLMSFAPSMRIAGQKYYVQQNVFDLRVLSTLGLSEEDIAAIAAVDGVQAVQPVKYQDVEAQWQGQSETAVVRLQQLPADPGADTAENMDRLVLLSGRMPEAPDEVMLVLDGSTGLNAFEQAKQFAAVTNISSLAITKLDGTAKGGVVIGISDQLKVPVKYIGLGEGMEDLQLFNKSEFVDSLFKH